MQRSIIYGIAVLVALSFGAQTFWAQQSRELRRIQGSYNDTATIAPTTQRIKSLNLPGGFSVHKFAELTNPRMLAAPINRTAIISKSSYLIQN